MDKYWKAKAQELAEFYCDDLPDADNLSVELHCWQLKWDEHQGEKPSDPRQTLPHADCAFFFNILGRSHALYQLRVASVNAAIVH